MAKETGVTLFDLDEGELFSFGYQPDLLYRLMGFSDDGNYAFVRAQRANADNENANPYYNNIIRR